MSKYKIINLKKLYIAAIFWNSLSQNEKNKLLKDKKNEPN